MLATICSLLAADTTYPAGVTLLVRRSWFAALLLCAVPLGAASGAPAGPLATGQRAEIRVSPAGIRAHLSAFQEIAERNGGNRLAGTAGYDASAGYVARRMRAAGYRVRFQEFSFPFVVDRTPPVLRVLGTSERFRAGRDYTTFAYSGSGRVEERVVAVDLLVPSPEPNASTSGCERPTSRRFRPVRSRCCNAARACSG